MQTLIVCLPLSDPFCHCTHYRSRGRRGAFYAAPAEPTAPVSITGSEVSLPSKVNEHAPHAPHSCYTRTPHAAASKLSSHSLIILTHHQSASRCLRPTKKPKLSTDADSGRITCESSRFGIGYAETIGKRPSMEDELTIIGHYRCVRSLCVLLQREHV